MCVFFATVPLLFPLLVLILIVIFLAYLFVLWLFVTVADYYRVRSSSVACILQK